MVGQSLTTTVGDVGDDGLVGTGGEGDARGGLLVGGLPPPVLEVSHDTRER